MVCFPVFRPHLEVLLTYAVIAWPLFGVGVHVRRATLSLDGADVYLGRALGVAFAAAFMAAGNICLLYTSDAADE